MEDALIAPTTSKRLKEYITNPGQSLAIIGDKWSNKDKIAQEVIAKILNIDTEKLSNYPYLINISPQDSKKIGIEEVRAASNLLNLKVSSKNAISRVILINDAQLMTKEAQNAILKDLEEPPEGSIFVLTCSSLSALLPTIVSRLKVVKLDPVSQDDLINYYASKGYGKQEVIKAVNMSGGQIGLTNLLLEDNDHPLNEATKIAKEFLQGSKFNKLNLINDLTKDKIKLNYFFFIIREMSLIGVKSPDTKTAKRWKGILSACLRSEEMLTANSQAKLVLTDFSLSIS